MCVIGHPTFPIAIKDRHKGSRKSFLFLSPFFVLFFSTRQRHSAKTIRITPITALTVTGDGDDVYALAATDGERKAMLISNVSAEQKEITTDLGEGFRVYLLDSDHLLELTDLSADKFTAEANQVFLICNYEAAAPSINANSLEVLYRSESGASFYHG